MKHTHTRQWASALTLCGLLLALLTPLGGATTAAEAAPAAGPASRSAAQALPPSTQFELIGHLEAASLDPSCASDAHCGGQLQVNGHLVTIPRETIVLLPANALTWQEIFAQAPAPYGLAATPPGSGLAVADTPAPLSTYEVDVVGNRVGDQYIAGLVWLSQELANTGAGYISSIDYATGELRVGGTIGDPNSGARVILNDPATVPDGKGGLTGRYSRGQSPDRRFTVDQENPTVTAETGFPMCVPRTDPAVADDPECPKGNRPLAQAGAPSTYATSVQMRNPRTEPGVFPNALKQAPLEVGDYITYAGTRAADARGSYISAHTLVDQIAIWTWPWSNPAYVRIDETLLGAGGLGLAGAAEAAARTRIEGMSTDPVRPIRIFGIDYTPGTGATNDRFWGLATVDPGPPTGRVRGRWRFQPRSSFTPATREVRAIITSGPLPGQPATFANGILSGQYHAPVGAYIFPEPAPGAPIVANNFESLDFLFAGGYASSAGTVVGPLSPWPGAGVVPPTCNPPVANAGGPYRVSAGGTVALVGSATGSAPLSFAWAPSVGTIAGQSSTTPQYTATSEVQAVPVSLTVTNACGSSSSVATVNVTDQTVPTVSPIAPVEARSGQAGVTLAATGSAGATFIWQQTGGPTVLAPNPKAGASITFNAPTLPVGQATPVTLSFQVTARNSAGMTSSPLSTTVTVYPLPDTITITVADYRRTGSRLSITATSSVVSPNVVLKLQPYMTVAGTLFDPARLGDTFTNAGGGSYTLNLVGAPEPLNPPDPVISVGSNLGGASPLTALTRIR